MMSDHPSGLARGSEVEDVEQIARGYGPGIIVRRWVGAWVDFLALLSFLVIPDFLLGNDVYQDTLAIWLTLACLYFPLLEGLTGRTLGKLVSGTVVLTGQSERPGVWKAFLRTLTRLLEVNPALLGGVPAGIAVLASDKRQRLGDMWAGTYVICARDVKRTRTP